MEAGLDFEAFYEAQYQRVFKAIYLSCGDRDLAHDVTQESFQRAYARWRRLSKHDWAGGWVMTTALNLLRRERRRPRSIYEDVDVVMQFVPHDRDLMVAIKKLPHRQRSAVLLYYLADMPVAAVASQMGIAEGTVKALLSQARTKLEKELTHGE